MDVLVNELLMRNIQLLFLVYYVISLIEVLNLYQYNMNNFLFYKLILLS